MKKITPEEIRAQLVRLLRIWDGRDREHDRAYKNITLHAEMDYTRALLAMPAEVST